jgi:hypothetical protein
MKTQFIRWIGLFAIGAFMLRQFWRISSFANGGVSRSVVRTDAILCGMTIALMISWLVSTLGRIFTRRLASTRIEEQIVTYSDIVLGMWEDVDLGFDEDVVCDPVDLFECAGRGVMPSDSCDDVDVCRVETYERAA